MDSKFYFLFYFNLVYIKKICRNTSHYKAFTVACGFNNVAYTSFILYFATLSCLQLCRRADQDSTTVM